MKCVRLYRLSYGVMHRLPRCSPDVPIQYKQWSIPIGVSLPRNPLHLTPPPSNTDPPGPRRHVLLPHAIRPLRLPLPRQIPPRPLALAGRWHRHQSSYESEFRPVLSRLSQLLRYEVGQSASPGSLLLWLHIKATILRVKIIFADAHGFVFF